MTGQRVGYIRVSSEDQNPDRQLEGISVARTFIDRASGRDTQRPALDALGAYVREGDTVVVHSMDRLARNLDDLRRLVRDWTARGIQVEFLQEHLTFSGDENPMARLLLSMMGAFAEFERALIRERQREGILLAKKRGVYQGRQKTLTADHVSALRDRVAHGVPKARVAREFGISRSAVYRYLQDER